jgi:type II secretion system (T2SS) protein M
MIRLGFSAKDRRTATVGIVTVGLLIGISKGLPALAEWENARVAQAADATARASAARANVRMLSILRDSLRSRKERLAAIDSALLSGTSAAAAAAELATLLDQMATRARLKVTAMQLRADSAPAGSLARVAVRVTAMSDVTGLAAFLRAAESSDTPLAIRELLVSQPEPAAPQSKPEALRIDVLVEGIARIGAARRT